MNSFAYHTGTEVILLRDIYLSDELKIEKGSRLVTSRYYTNNPNDIDYYFRIIDKDYSINGDYIIPVGEYRNKILEKILKDESPNKFQRNIMYKRGDIVILTEEYNKIRGSYNYSDKVKPGDKLTIRNCNFADYREGYYYGFEEVDFGLYYQYVESLEEYRNKLINNILE